MLTNEVRQMGGGEGHVAGAHAPSGVPPASEWYGTV